MQFIKNVLLAIFVLILSAAIFFFLVKDQQFTDDILKSTLQLFGDDLMAMVPDGEEKELLKKKYDEFLHKADQEELPPEEIERVAAVILNLTTQDTVVQAEDALSALNLNNEDLIYTPKVPFPKQAPEKRIFDKISKKDRPPRLEPFDWNEEDKREMAERLTKVKDFHKKIHKRIQHDTTLKALQNQVLFNADSGLTVALNIRLKEDMAMLAEDKALQEQMEMLEKENILIWKATIEHQKQAGKALKMVLEQLPQITVNMGEMLQNSEMFDSIQIDVNQYFNSESLEKMIEEHVKEFENFNPDSLIN